MKVVVFGGSGRTGRPLVRKLLDAGHDVVAVSRNADALAAVSPEQLDHVDRADRRLELRGADVRDVDAVRAAVKGAAAVISSIAPPLRQHLVRSTTLYSASGTNLVGALTAERVDRLIVVSSAGVRADDPNHPPIYRYVLKPALFDRALYRDMRVMEEVVAASQLAWTCVRASGLTDGTETQAYRIGTGQLPERGSRISRADLAAFLTTQLTDSTYVRAYPTVAY